jgi:heme a synthase
MISLPIGSSAYPATTEIRLRFWFSVATVASTVALVAWGAFVTSINAGMAVPDWPTSFQSYDPFNPWPEWWTITPVLAEHGHRLLGMLVGLMTMILAIWTGIADPRRWMRYLGYAALVLVIFQGVLGGLRVVFVSLNLAMVHAAFAQIFFATAMAMTLFVSRGWLEARDVLPPSRPTRNLRLWAWIAVGVLYMQIVLGVLLRHPGTGLDPMLAMMHIAGAMLSLAVIIYVLIRTRRDFGDARYLRQAVAWLIGAVLFQIALGFTAYFVILDELGMIEPSNFQVVINSLHLVVGAFLFSATVIVALIAARRGRPVSNAEIPNSVTSTTLQSA